MSNPLPTCCEDLRPKSSYRRAPFTPRRALQSHARLGSIYDARCDRMLHNSIQSLSITSITAKNLPHCFMKNCSTDDTCGILQMMNLHQDLRLSIALQLVPPDGIAAIYNYDHPIDQYTRLLSYELISRTEYLSDEYLDYFMGYRQQQFELQGTHVVILINYGISVFILIQLPPEDLLANTIDQILDQNCRKISSGTRVDSSTQDQLPLKHIVRIGVFSNVSSLSTITSMSEFYENIDRLRHETDRHRPYNYNLCPISRLFQTSQAQTINYCEISEQSVLYIEDIIRKIKKEVIRLRKAITRQYPYCQKYFKNFMQDIKQQSTALTTAYEKTLRQIAQGVTNIRSGTIRETTSIPTTMNQILEEFQKGTDQFNKSAIERDLKENVLENLESKRIKYSNARDFGIETGDTDQTILMKVKRTYADVFILCSTDQFYSQDRSQWNDHCNRLIDHRKNNDSKIQALYLDFTDHPYKLQRPKILYDDPTKKDSTSRSSSFPAGQPETRRKYDTINILLFGETGVGKSTFINALVNYLRFDTFQQADINKPIVLLPISFMLTSGHEFTEHHVNYPGIDTQCDEQHDQLGQSVTQHCRSYLFTIKDDQQQEERKVRLIDTPGIGDTRGIDQDEKNMQEILMFINSLSQLHAICIILKPNVARLDIMFRRCLSQLLDMLGADVKDHIMFCFTNTRSTFYAPGDTGPVLMKFLEEAPVKSIKLSRENTFCFDSESFRYLVAKQQHVPFDMDETEQFRKTWDRSSVETKRFLSSIVRKTTAYEIRNNHQSMEQARLEITLLIRPIMEAIRNLNRNIILTEQDQRNNWIELEPNKLRKYATVCHTCPLKLKECGSFQIVANEEHDSHKQCLKCRCTPDCHTPIQYLLDYKERSATSKPSFTEWRTDSMILCQTSVILAYFLSKYARSSSQDRFLAYLEKMIEEEKCISERTSMNFLNQSLIKNLKNVKRAFEDMMKDQMKVDGATIYESIEKAKTHALVQSQWNAIESWCKSMVNFQEFTVPKWT